MRGKRAGFKQFTCEHCGLQKSIKKYDNRRFCTRSCGLKWEHASGRRKVGFDPHKSMYQYWVESHGKHEADLLLIEYKKTLSESIRQTDMSHQKLVASQLMSNYNSSKTGKTYDEIYGKEVSLELRSKRSRAMTGDKNPSYGKVYVDGGKSVKGYYKGRYFRSLLEYSFMKHVEQLGLSLNDVEYETHCICYSMNGNDRTYRPDFYVPSQRTLYEVKPFYAIKNENNLLKWEAAQKYCCELGLTFKVITEKEFKKIEFDVALNDPDIKWKEKTFEYFNRDRR